MKKDKIDKLTDKAFFRLIITSVLAIVFCLFCLCSTTWAWFNESENSASNSIRSANCTLSITVAKDANNKIDIGFEDGEKIVDLEAGVEYTVTLSIPQDSASGYCIISLNGVDMYSQSVSNNGAPYERTLSFTVVADADTKVTFAPSWGIYSGDTVIQDGETVLVSANTFVIETESESESESESASEEASESESESESEDDVVGE